MIEIPSHAQALLFDCDGTLADTMPIHYKAWHTTLLEYGVDCPRSYIDAHAGVPTVLIATHVCRDFGVTFDPEQVAHEKEARFAERIGETLPIKPVVATAREYFGKLPMGVVSGGTRDLVVPTLEAIDVLALFPVIVTASDPVAPKPSPDVFLEAARQLGVDPTLCHVFEDGDPGIVAAKAAGMSVTDVRHLGN